MGLPKELKKHYSMGIGIASEIFSLFFLPTRRSLTSSLRKK
jgi:hypothetical protein